MLRPAPILTPEAPRLQRGVANGALLSHAFPEQERHHFFNVWAMFPGD